MRISDWSSVVCSSDLCAHLPQIWRVAGHRDPIAERLLQVGRVRRGAREFGLVRHPSAKARNDRRFQKARPLLDGRLHRRLAAVAQDKRPRIFSYPDQGPALGRAVCWEREDQYGRMQGGTGYIKKEGTAQTK